MISINSNEKLITKGIRRITKDDIVSQNTLLQYKFHVKGIRLMSDSNTVKLVDELNNARRIYRNGLLIVRNSMLEISAAKRVEIKPLNILVDKIMGSLSRNPDALLCVSRNKPQNDYTIAHSLSVCIFIAAFTQRLNIEENEAKQIALGALLGDVGKLRISNEILNKPGELTKKEFTEVKKHAKYTYALLYASKCFTETTIRAATEHHERMDGSGYPFGLEETQISNGGQMTAIADVYDALASPRVYQDAKEPKDVFKLMYSWKDSQFKKSMLKKFVRMVGMYPVGSMVALSNAKLAVVVNHGIDDMLLPKVKTIFDLRNKILLQKRECLDLEEMNAQNGVHIIRPIGRNEFNFNPISALGI